MKNYGRRIFVWTLLAVLVVGAATLYAERSSPKGYLGVIVDRLSHEDRRETGLSHGVIVDRVEEASPAEEAGIEEDDVILYFDGTKIRRTEDLTNVVRDTEPGKEAKVTVNRDGRRLDLDVEVGRLRERTVHVYGWDDDHRVIRLGGGGAYLGVRLNELNDDLASYFGVEAGGGVLILETLEDGPAEEAGLKAGDVILTLDGAEVGNSRDVREVLSEFGGGDEVEVGIMRQRRQERIAVELEGDPDPHAIHILRRWPTRHRERLDIDIPGHLEEMELREMEAHRLPERLDERFRSRMEDLEERIERSLRGVEKRAGIPMTTFI